MQVSRKSGGISGGNEKFMARKFVYLYYFV